MAKASLTIAFQIVDLCQGGEIDAATTALTFSKSLINFGAEMLPLVKDMGKFAPFLGPTSMLAVGLIDMFLPQPPSVQEQLQDMKEEILEETKILIQDAVLGQSFKELEIEIQNFATSSMVSSALDLMEPDAALAYALALETPGSRSCLLNCC